MTTTVTVNAHCDPKTTKVEVQVTDGESVEPKVYLNDGESQDFYAYDGRQISVCEVAK